MSTITPFKLRCTCLDEARWTASIKDNSVLDVAGIHRFASWNRGEDVSKRRPHKSRELSLTSRNALKHGLSIPVNRDKTLRRQIEVLARILVQSEAGNVFWQARAAAEA